MTTALRTVKTILKSMKSKDRSQMLKVILLTNLTLGREKRVGRSLEGQHYLKDLMDLDDRRRSVGAETTVKEIMAA